MSLTLAVDHRAMDGIQGAKFLGELKERIEQPLLFALEDPTGG
jgi:pyruvate/2-oxoglutarate dehydrogenase complex dihydrolipoamide acyltransferase (E2) component